MTKVSIELFESSLTRRCSNQEGEYMNQSANQKRAVPGFKRVQFFPCLSLSSVRSFASLTAYLSLSRVFYLSFLVPSIAQDFFSFQSQSHKHRKSTTFTVHPSICPRHFLVTLPILTIGHTFNHSSYPPVIVFIQSKDF